MDEKNMKRATNLKLFVNQRRIKNEELQQITGWSRATSFRKLKGTSDITDEELRRIVDAYGLKNNIFDLSIDEFEEEIIECSDIPIFINNVRCYIEAKKIKKEYLSKKIGISSVTLDKYLSSEMHIGKNEMLKIANALRKTIDYFLNENFQIRNNYRKEQIAFFSGQPTGEQVATTHNLIEFINYYDALQSMASISNNVKGVD